MANKESGGVAGWHGRWKPGKRVLGIGLLAAALGCLGSGTAAALTLSSTVREDNGATTNIRDGNQDLYSTPTAGNATITTAGGYTFAPAYMTLTSITSITITITVNEGNTE